MEGVVSGGLILFYVLFLLPFLFYLRTLHRCQQIAKKRNRSLSKSLLLLNLIPLFNFFWAFFTVIQTSNTITDEYDDLKIKKRTSGGRTVGILYATLALMCCIPYVGIFALLPCILFWILHWNEVSTCTRDIKRQKEKNKLEAFSSNHPGLKQIRRQLNQ